MFDNEKQVEQLIEQLKETDEQFAVAVTNKKKSMQGFMAYFFQCAQAAYVKAIGRTNGYMSGIGEDDVRSLMIHYWTEDNPKVGDIELGTAKFAKVASEKSGNPKKSKTTAPAAPKGKVPAAPATPAKPAAPVAKSPIAAPTATKPAAPVVPMAAVPKPAPVVGFCDDDDFDID